MKFQSAIPCLLVLAIISCKKFLEATPDKKLVVVSSVRDLQSLLDDYSLVNQRDPGALETGADNYYITDADWLSRTEDQRNMYIWNKDHVFPGFSNDWSLMYDNVYRANTVLDNIEKLKSTAQSESDWQDVMGQALFLRGKSFFQIASIWSLAYDKQTAQTDPGIPLRLKSDFNEVSVRNSAQQTYDQIIQDLKQASSLLPNTPIHVLRASKSAAYGMLARVYLSMRQYDSCKKYSDLCLQLKNDLMDYNTLNASASFPFAPAYSSKEIIYDCVFFNPSLMISTIAKVDSALYSSYVSNDLRKTVFFASNGNGTFKFKGSYFGSTTLWDGVAVDEVYLMRAESNARTGDVTSAMKDLNDLMRTRWKKINGVTTYVDQVATDSHDAVSKILTERRKELLYRGLRWMDVKRLNKEGDNITMKRVVNGQTYVLAPNDPRFAMAIPEDVIIISGMPQNPR
jgi:hypothetical protein